MLQGPFDTHKTYCQIYLYVNFCFSHKPRLVALILFTNAVLQREISLDVIKKEVLWDKMGMAYFNDSYIT
jgi:hypothetical protein